MSKQDFEFAIANAPRSLIDAQREYTKWYELLGTARDQAADAEIAYEIEFANFIRDKTADASDSKTITVLKEHGKAHCAAQYTAKVRADTQVKKCQDALAHAESRMNTSKKLIELNFKNVQ